MKGLIFTYLLTYGGAVASLYRPYIGLLVYVCFAIIKPDALWHWAVPPGNYSRIVAIGLLVGWGLHGFGNWNLGRARAVVLALVAFLLWAAVASLGAVDRSIAFDFIESHAKIVLPFIVGVTVINSVTQLKQLAWVIVLSEGYVAFEANLTYFRGFNQIQQYGFAGMDNNTVAITLVASIGLAFFLGLHAPRWWQKLLAFGTALMIAHAVMLTFSRGGLLALILTGAAAFVLIRKRPAHYAVLIVAAVIGFRLAGPEVRERFETAFANEKQRDRSASLRVLHWQACSDSMLRRPLGVGPNQWRFYSPEYGLPSMEAHSYWLQTGAELGFPGLAAILAFYGLCIVRLWPLARERIPLADPWLSYVARMVIASLVGFALSAQFVSVLGVEIPFYVALLGAGALKLASTQTVPGRAALAVRPGLYLNAPAAALG